MYHLRASTRKLKQTLSLRNIKFRSRSSKRQTYLVGEKCHGYTVQQNLSVPELSLTAIKLQHENTGAEHLHIARDDDNNVFGVSFRTTPQDSTGVPHILEHTTLCGSKNYPVRDPFFKMLTRSLNTFMNAFTAADWTMYPFSTQNSQDYSNLLSVYLDAVFNPLLSQQDFSQEGWRIEHEIPQDANSPLVFKGVVYNEMKGVFSNSQHVFSQANQNALLPSHTYGVVSGGDPRKITDLTWEQLCSFHTAHYHPSNARFYTYGNIPLEKHLEQIEKQVLSHHSAQLVETSVPLEPRWKQPKELTITCRADPMAPDPDKQTTVAVSYLLSDVTDTWEQFVLGVLCSLLVDGDMAPFYRSLLEPNIGSDFAPTTGYSSYTRESTFSVGLQGIHKADVPRVCRIMEDTFDEVINEGIEEERIEAVLHKLELSLKYQTPSFGLHLALGVIPSWNHDGNPCAGLQVTQLMQRFRTEMKNDPYFLQNKIEQYFKNNNHKLTLIMSPDDSYESDKMKEEEERLENHISQLTSEDKQDIYKFGCELLESQSKKQDPSCLPSLTVADIPQTITPVVTTTSSTDGISVQYSEQPTNGLTFFRGLCDLSDLEAELVPYVSLFSKTVTRMGAGAMDYRELGQKAELFTGGLNAGTHIAGHHTNPNEFSQGVLFSSHCLDRNLEAMFDLWTEIFNRLDLSDMGRLDTLIRMEASDMAMGIADRGHMYAISHASSTLDSSGNLREVWGGMSQVSLMKTVAEMTDLTPIVNIFKQIASHVLNKNKMRFSVNCTPENFTEVTNLMEKFIRNLPSYQNQSTVTKEKNLETKSEQSHFVLPFSVNFVGKSYKTVPFRHEDFAKLTLLGQLMTWKYLHSEIREKGGAYGGGASCSPGYFNFYSYRDPNLEKTLSAFERGVDWAIDGNFDQQDIDEAKLAVFAKVDAPIAPGSRGIQQFLTGVDDNMKQKHREQLFAVTKSDLCDVAQRYLSSNCLHGTTVLGPQNNYTEEDSKWIKKIQS